MNDFDMEKAKQVTINGIQGNGYAEIIVTGNRKECKGIALFTEAMAIKKDFYSNSKKREAQYRGIVY